jgi:ParB family transcriptional regulator, chromosome partitioning protein
MNNNTNKLGKGLSSLLGEKKLDLNSGLMSIDLMADKVQLISIDLLEPNKFQPRKFFNDGELKELSLSIKEYGILQPIVVRKLITEHGKFEIIAGERRFRAGKIAGLSSIPVIVKDFNDKDALSLAIIENVQRSDLSVMEEAEAYDMLIKNFNYTQLDIAKFVGKSRSHVANIIRLLELPHEVKELLYQKKIDMGHARALINCDKAIEIANAIVESDLSVRDTEKLAKSYIKEKFILQKKAQISLLNHDYFKKVENNLFGKINLKSKINFDYQKKKGKIIINYDSIEQLEEFLNKIK